nr:CG42737-RA [synthetic construct]
MKRCSRINRTGIERSQLLTRLNCRSDEVVFDFVCATGAHFLRRIWICSNNSQDYHSQWRHYSSWQLQ